MGGDEYLSGLLDLLKRFGWDTKIGLPIFILVTIIIESLTLGILGQAHVILPAKTTLIIFGGSAVLITLIWLFRWFAVYRPGVLVMGIAVQADSDGLDFYNKLRSTISRSLAEQGIGSSIKFREFPRDVHLADSESAEKFIISNGIGVLIWGDTASGTINGVESTRFNIKISYQYASGTPEQARQLENLLQATNKRAFWDVQKTNSLPTLDIVAGNVVEMGLFTLAISLYSLRNLEHRLAAVRILEKLNKRLEGRVQDFNFPNLDYTRQEIRRFLSRSYESLRTYYSLKDDFDSTHVYAEKALKLNPRDWKAHQDIATTSWYKGDHQAARYHTDESLRLNRKNELAKINLAFLSIADGNYKGGLQKYKHLKPKFLNRTNVLKVIAFNLNEYDKTGEVAFLFTAGWLNVRYADHAAGKHQLEDFLNLAKDTKYKVLQDEASEIIRAIK